MKSTVTARKRQRVPISIVVRPCGQVDWDTSDECQHSAVLFSHQLNGACCRFCADTMPELGPFVEIERPS